MARRIPISTTATPGFFSQFRLTILDWYILKKYLFTFLFICLIFTLISVVVDFSEKLDDVIERKASTREIIFDYYLNFIPYINGLLWPLFSLIAVIFFTSRLASNSEFISMIGCGVNFYRLLVPYFIGGFLIFITLLFANHYFIPNGNKRRVKFENTYIWLHNYKNRTDNIHMNAGNGEEVYIRNFSVADSTCRDFMLLRYDGQKNTYRIQAAVLSPVTGQPGLWKMQNWEARTFDGLNERIYKGLAKDTLLSFRPSDFIRRDNLKESMTTPELSQFIADERRRGSNPSLEFEVERYRRTSEPFTILILTLIGVSVASRKVRGGMGIHLLIGAATGGVYIFMTKFSATFAIQGGLPPLLGVWVPNIIFTIVAVWMLRNMAQK